MSDTPHLVASDSLVMTAVDQSGSNPVATPTFTPGSGSFTTSQNVIISCATSGATIRYTTDGSTPSRTNGTTISGGSAVTLTTTTTLKAMAYKDGMTDSAVAQATYTRTGTETPSDVTILANGRISSPGTSIVVNGEIYDGGAGVNATGLVGVVKDERAYLYHPALGDVKLSEETSRRAVGELITDFMLESASRNAKGIVRQMPIGGTVKAETGVTIRRDSQNGYQISNPRNRWIVVKRGDDQPVFIPPRTCPIDTNIFRIGSLALSRFELSSNAMVDINSPDIETFGAMTTIMPFSKLPLIGSSIKNKWDRAYAADSRLFMRLNAVEYVELCAQGIGNILGAIDVSDCMQGTFIFGALASFEGAILTDLTGDPKLVQDRIIAWSQDATQSLALCACNLTVKGAVVCGPLNTLLDILGTFTRVVDDTIIRSWHAFKNEAYDSVPHEGYVSSPVCGNGICEGTENYTNCPIDCMNNECYVTEVEPNDTRENATPVHFICDTMTIKGKVHGFSDYNDDHDNYSFYLDEGITVTAKLSGWVSMVVYYTIPYHGGGYDYCYQIKGDDCPCSFMSSCTRTFTTHYSGIYYLGIHIGPGSYRPDDDYNYYKVTLSK